MPMGMRQKSNSSVGGDLVRLHMFGERANGHLDGRACYSGLNLFPSFDCASYDGGASCRRLKRSQDVPARQADGAGSEVGSDSAIPCNTCCS